MEFSETNTRAQALQSLFTEIMHSADQSLRTMTRLSDLHTDEPSAQFIEVAKEEADGHERFRDLFEAALADVAEGNYDPMTMLFQNASRVWHAHQAGKMNEISRDEQTMYLFLTKKELDKWVMLLPNAIA